MEHSGHRDRLRKRFEQNRLSGFADHEALELLLTYAIPRIDVNPLAHRLMERFGSFSAVMEATKEELMAVDGIGEKSASMLTMLLPLMQRYEQSKRMGRKHLLKTFHDMAGYCASLFVGCREERFYLLCFDAKLRLTRDILLSSGVVDEVQVLPRMVAREAMRANAASVVVAHNHPSGIPDPSLPDAELTEGIRDALQTVGIRFLDHVVVGNGEVYSFQRNDTLPLQQYENTVHLAAEDAALMKGRKTERTKCREDEEPLWY